MNFSTFTEQPVPRIQIIFMLHVTKELREREMEGRESPSPIKKETCLVTGVYNYCIVEDPISKVFLFFSPSIFNLFSIQ